jgi:hypothetical protein
VGTDSPSLRRKAVPSTVFLARIIVHCLLDLPIFTGEGKTEPVAASSAEGSIRVVHRWFIRDLEAENAATWRRSPRSFAGPPGFTTRRG